MRRGDRYTQGEKNRRYRHGKVKYTENRTEMNQMKLDARLCVVTGGQTEEKKKTNIEPTRMRHKGWLAGPLHLKCHQGSLSSS